MADIKIFAMNESDWYAAENADDAKRAMAETLCFDTTREGIAAMCEEYEVNPDELTTEQMDTLQFRDEVDENGDLLPDGRTISFRAKLDEIVAAGDEFPCFFASTEC